MKIPKHNHDLVPWAMYQKKNYARSDLQYLLIPMHDLSRNVSLHNIAALNTVLGDM